MNMLELIPIRFYHDPFCSSEFMWPQVMCISKINVKTKNIEIIGLDFINRMEHYFHYMRTMFIKEFDELQHEEEIHITILYNDHIICFDPIRFYADDMYTICEQSRHKQGLINMYRPELRKFEISDIINDKNRIEILTSPDFWRQYKDEKHKIEKYINKMNYFPDSNITFNSLYINVTEAALYFQNKRLNTWSDIIDHPKCYNYNTIDPDFFADLVKFVKELRLKKNI